MIYNYIAAVTHVKVGSKVRKADGMSNPCNKLNDGEIHTITEVVDGGFSIDGCHHSASSEGAREYIEILDYKPMKEKSMYPNTKKAAAIELAKLEKSLASEVKKKDTAQVRIAELNSAIQKLKAL